MLDNLIHQYNPDVIVGTESQLYPPVRYFHQAMKYLEEIGQMAMGASSWLAAKIIAGKTHLSKHLITLKQLLVN